MKTKFKLKHLTIIQSKEGESKHFKIFTVELCFRGLDTLNAIEFLHLPVPKVCFSSKIKQLSVAKSFLSEMTKLQKQQKPAGTIHMLRGKIKLFSRYC